MVKIAVISDSHGNLGALDAVLAELDVTGPYDQVIFGGDFALGGPRPAECIARIRQRGYRAVRGNTDEFIVEAATGGRRPAQVGSESQRQIPDEVIRWAAQRIPADDITYLAELPLALTLGGAGRPALAVVHATPWNTHDTVRADADEALATRMLDEAGTEALAYGHIHVQYRREVDGRLLAAVGSVGFPFDGDQRAAYAVFSTAGGGWDVEFRRVAYDVEAAIEATLASGAPGCEVFAGRLRTASPSAG